MSITPGEFAIFIINRHFIFVRMIAVFIISRQFAVYIIAREFSLLLSEFAAHYQHRIYVQQNVIIMKKVFTILGIIIIIIIIINWLSNHLKN